jgi:hypothetical protein
VPGYSQNKKYYKYLTILLIKIIYGLFSKSL